MICGCAAVVAESALAWIQGFSLFTSLALVVGWIAGVERLSSYGGCDPSADAVAIALLTINGICILAAGLDLRTLLSARPLEVQQETPALPRNDAL